MFATLLGALPRPPLPSDAAAETLVRAVVDAQASAGLEPVTDGGWWGVLPAVDAWRATAKLADRAVKQVLAGPFSSAPRRSGESTSDWVADARAAAEATNLTLRALADAGCQLVEIHEPATVRIGADEAAWALFRETQLIATDGIVGTHLSLAITGGAADLAGLGSILAAPYASLAVDLIAGPENWRLVRATPGERGIICGALSPEAGSDDGPETLLWAAAYAASSDGRGPDRVGLASASSLAGLTWEAAIRKLACLGDAVRLARLPADELRATLDPRAIDSRSAALGRAGSPAPARAVRPSREIRHET